MYRPKSFRKSDSAKWRAPAEPAAYGTQQNQKKESLFAVGPIAAAWLQLAYLAAAWIITMTPGVARNLPGVRTVQLLLKMDWMVYLKAVTSCGDYIIAFIKQPAQATLAALAVLNEDQLNNLTTQLGLSQGMISFLLMAANVIVLAIYLTSTLTVIRYLLPALKDIAKLTLKLNNLVQALVKLFEKVPQNPVARVAAHWCMFAASLYVVAAGSIVAPNAPLAGLLLSVLGHLSAAGFVVANQKASATSTDDKEFKPVEWSRPALLLSIGLASSAVGYQNLFVGAVAVAAMHAAAQAQVNHLEITSDACFWASTITSMTLLGLSIGARLAGVPVSWYAPFNLGVATFSKHILFVAGLMHTNDGGNCALLKAQLHQRLSNNAFFLVECLAIGLFSHWLAMTDMENTVWIYVNAWAAWRLQERMPKSAENVGRFLSAVLVCHGCYFMLTHPWWFKSVIAL